MRRTVLCGLLGILFCAFFAVAQGRADGIDNFTYQAGGNTFNWQLPATPTPDAGNISLGLFFTLANASFTENGVATTGRFAFFSFDDGGGFSLNNTLTDLIDAFDPQLYSGTEDAPTFLLGTFQLTDFANDANGVPATLTISAAPVAPVPEPSSLLLFASGLLALGIGLAVKKMAV